MTDSARAAAATEAELERIEREFNAVRFSSAKTTETSFSSHMHDRDSGFGATFDAFARHPIATATPRPPAPSVSRPLSDTHMFMEASSSVEAGNVSTSSQNSRAVMAALRTLQDKIKRLEDQNKALVAECESLRQQHHEV